MADKTFERTADDELIARAREGDSGAFGQLWVRHAPAAHAVSRSFTSLDADDVVAEAFARILAAIKKGSGPTTAFRPYLLTTVRNVAREWGTRAQRVVDTTGLDEEAQDGAPDAAESALAAMEASETAKVFLNLPVRWQEALWYSEIDGLKPRQFAPLMGIAPNAASALVLRARRGFRDAWITTQLRNPASPACQDTLELLGSHTRGALSRRDARRVDAHVADCAPCALAWDEAREVSSRLALVLVPAVTGAPASAAYSTWAHAGGAQAMALALGAKGGGATAGSTLTKLALRVPTRSVIGATVSAVAATCIVTVAVALAVSPQDAAPPAAGTSAPSAVDPSPVDRSAVDPSADGAPVPPPSVASPQPDLDPRAGLEQDSALSPAPSPTPTPVPEDPDPRGPTPGGGPTPSPTPTPTATPTPTLEPPTMIVDLSAGGAVYPLISGVADPNATVEIVDETGAVRASVRANATGSWSADDLSGGTCTTTADAYLGAGTHTVAARQRVGDLLSPVGSAQGIEIAPPPQIVSPREGSTVSASGFDLTLRGVPGLSVQRIKLPDDAPCRTDWMRLNPMGSFSQSYSAPPGQQVTLGVRYIDEATGRHGPATFTVFVAK